MSRSTSSLHLHHIIWAKSMKLESPTKFTSKNKPPVSQRLCGCCIHADLFAGRLAITLITVKFFLWTFSFILFSNTTGCNCATELYGRSDTGFIVRNDSLDVTRQFSGSQKQTILRSILIQFVCRRNTPTRSIGAWLRCKSESLEPECTEPSTNGNNSGLY